MGYGPLLQENKMKAFDCAVAVEWKKNRKHLDILFRNQIVKQKLKVHEMDLSQERQTLQQEWENATT